MSSSDSSIVRSAGEGGTEEGGLLIGRDMLVKLNDEQLSDGGREACKEDRRARPPEDGGLEMRDMHTESRAGHSSSLCIWVITGLFPLLPFLMLSSESRLFSGLL